MGLKTVKLKLKRGLEKFGIRQVNCVALLINMTLCLLILHFVNKSAILPKYIAIS